jgi:hypothetical protein
MLATLAEIASAQPGGVPPSFPVGPTGAARPGLSASPVASASEGQESAEQLMRRTVDAFDGHRSFSARLRHQVKLFDQNLLGKGTYHQLGAGFNKLLRVEMTIKASGQGAASQLAHVCDGRYLWMFEEIGSRANLSRVDLRRVNRAIEAAKKNPTQLIRSPPTLSLGSGGLGRLLGDLHEQFEMHAVRADKLGTDPVWIVDGRWRSKRLLELLPKQADNIRAGKSPDLERLAPHLPHEVRLTLSRDKSLLPYRVEFARSKHDEASDTTQRTAIVAMEIYEIKVNEALDPQLFVYKPGSVEIVDRTEKFLVQRGLMKKKKEEKK